MSKLGYISRYSFLIKKLQTKPYSSFEDIKAFMESRFENLLEKDETLNIGFSKRTLQRDIKEIKNVFGIDIEYSIKEKGYYIVNSIINEMNFQRIIDEFEVFHSLSLVQDISPFIYLEKRKPQGTENLYGLLHAIKNKLQVAFAYHKYWDDDISERTVAPHALKEFEMRWYLLAKDMKDDELKTFALDRMSELTITKKTFSFPKNLNIKASFRHCFGIITSKKEPEKIVLSFAKLQGKYIKSLPLHESQKILIDDEKEFRIQLNLCITHDLVMKLLSFGEHMKVLQPTALIQQIKDAHQDAYEQY